MHEVQLLQRVLSRIQSERSTDARGKQRVLGERELVDIAIHETLAALGIQIAPDGTLKLATEDKAA